MDAIHISIIGLGLGLTVLSIAVCVIAAVVRKLVHDQWHSALGAARYLARAQWLAKRYGKGNAFHVCEDGVLLAVRAEEYLLALFAGIEGFWKLVSKDRRAVKDGFAYAEELYSGDGEWPMSVVHANCGKAYLDTVDFPGDLPYPYLCSRATVKDLREELENRHECGDGSDRGRDGHDVHGANSTTTA